MIQLPYIHPSYHNIDLFQSEKLALGLIHLGVEKGDRIGIWSPNHYEWIVTQFAAALAGLILVNVNPMYKSEDLYYALDKVGIKALILPPNFKRSNYYETLASIMPELAHFPEGRSDINSNTFPKLRHLIIFNDDGKAFRGAWRYSDVCKMFNDDDRRKLSQIEKNVQPDDPANIQYTSGTTGKYYSTDLIDSDTDTDTGVGVATTLLWLMWDSCRSLVFAAPVLNSVYKKSIRCSVVCFQNDRFRSQRELTPLSPTSFTFSTPLLEVGSTSSTPTFTSES